MQYEMRFSELARHSIWLIPTYRERIRRFVDGLTYQLQIFLTRERVSDTFFEEVVDIAREIESVHRQERVEREAKRTRGSGSFGSIPFGGLDYPCSSIHVSQAMVAAVAVPDVDFIGDSEVVDIAREIESVHRQERVEREAKRPRGSGSFGGIPFSPLPVAGRGCFEYGDLSHIKRFYPRIIGGSSQQKSQPSASAPARGK
uniref:Uncharacterized protein LOC104238032 n=1 Tax=Nicotiana sylvestris TaxID=4096 RepID=A0A1U7XUK8_NICSY